jgi:branched-chain amino acid transport system substrate-binding protein
VTLRFITTIGRQPSRLPFAFVASWLVLVLIVLAMRPDAPAMAQATDGDIVIMSVDSSRVPEPDGASHRVAPRPVGEGVDEVARGVNNRGGLLGRRLRVVHENDQCEADEAAAIAARAVAQKVDVVIGHPCPSGAIKAAALYTQAGVVMIATGPRHPRLTSPVAHREIFRLAGRDDRQDDSIAALITSTFPGSRAAIIHDRSLQGRGMAEEIRRSMNAAGLPPVLVATYTSGIKDHATIVSQLAAARVNLAVFPGQPFEASMILDQANRAGARIATAIGTDVLAVDVPPARLLAAVDTFLVMLPWPGMGDGAHESTKDNTARELAGAALQAWAAAVAEAGSLAPDRVTEALRGAARPTRLGALRFDAKGDAMVPSYLPHAWRSGSWQAWRPGAR